MSAVLLLLALSPVVLYGMIEFLRTAKDAARYRALRDGKRMRFMGYAGKLRPLDQSRAPDGHVHAGIEFWSHYRLPEMTEEELAKAETAQEDARKLFDAFADKMVEAKYR